MEDTWTMFQRRLMLFQSFTSKLLEIVARVRDEKGGRLLPHPIRRHNRLKARDKTSSQGPGCKQGNSIDKNEIPCRFKFCENPSCKFWHPPVCLNHKSEKGCVHGDKCHFRHVEAEGKPNKKSKKGGAKGSVAIFEGLYTIWLCISRFFSEKMYAT